MLKNVQCVNLGYRKEMFYLPWFSPQMNENLSNSQRSLNYPEDMTLMKIFFMIQSQSKYFQPSS